MCSSFYFCAENQNFQRVENRQYGQNPIITNPEYIHNCYHRLFKKFANWKKLLIKYGLDENIAKRLYVFPNETSHYEPHIHYFKYQGIDVKFSLLNVLNKKFSNDSFKIEFNYTDLTRRQIIKIIKKIYEVLSTNREITKFLIALYYNQNKDVYVQIKDKKILSIIEEICNSK